MQSAFGAHGEQAFKSQRGGHQNRSMIPLISLDIERVVDQAIRSTQDQGWKVQVCAFERISRFASIAGSNAQESGSGVIDPLPEIPARLEVRNMFVRDPNRITRFGISPNA